MWAQLGMAALNGLQNEKNRKDNIASNVIKEKYSHWTGNNGDFSQQGQNGMTKSLASGLAAGMAQDQYDAALEKADLAAERAAQKAEWKEDADFYRPGQVGTPIGGSSFSAIAKQAPPISRAPATPDAPVPQQQELPPFLQGQNPWLTMAQQPVQQRQPQMSDFHQPAKSFNPPGAAWFGYTPIGKSMGY